MGQGKEKPGVSPKNFFGCDQSAPFAGKATPQRAMRVIYGSVLLAKRHIFMLALAGLACLNQWLLLCTL
jgi:hypothetical protein